MRRNSFRLKVLNIIECPRCHTKKIAHRVCQSCGYYNNAEIIQMEAKSKSKPAEKEAEKSKAKSDSKKSSGTENKEKVETKSKR
jgi:large subunit ribosomal protein L32